MSRFVILCICWDTPSKKTSLWQLPKVSSAFKTKACLTSYGEKEYPFEQQKLQQLTLFVLRPVNNTCSVVSTIKTSSRPFCNFPKKNQDRVTPSPKTNDKCTLYVMYSKLPCQKMRVHNKTETYRQQLLIKFDRTFSFMLSHLFG